MGAINLRNILGFLSQPNINENLITDIFQSEDIFFQNNITSLIQFRMFFSNSENGSVDGVEGLWLFVERI